MAQLEAAGFDKSRFLALAATLREGDAKTRRSTRNCVKGRVEAAKPGEIGTLPLAGSPESEALREKGEAAMRNGELAFCTMAGGMATRMGGIVKALADALPGHSFLSMRLAENATSTAKAGQPIPLWLMTSEATHQEIVEALKKASAPSHVGAFMQNLSLRLTPEGDLFFDDQANPSPY